MGKKSQKNSRSNNNEQSFIAMRLSETFALLCLFLSAYLFLSLFSHNPNDPSFNVASPSILVENGAGKWGAYMSDYLLQSFGLSAFLLPIIAGGYAFQLLMHKESQDRYIRIITLPILLVSLAVILQMWHPLPLWPNENGMGNGGIIGKFSVKLLTPLMGSFGVASIASISFLMASMLWTGLTLKDLYHACRVAEKFTRHWLVVAVRRFMRIKFKKALQIDLPLPIPRPKKIKRAQVEQQAPTKATVSQERLKEQQAMLPLDLKDNSYQMPPLHLFSENKDAGTGESEDALQQNARMIEQQLSNFGVKGVVNKICPGPVITIYELEPAAGVKTATIVGLSNDLARAMSATAIRIAPVPGRTVIGIEMPNKKRKMVGFKDIIATEKFETDAGKLTVVMGVDTAGQPVLADISKMPHALIAGTTGSGKSVAMNGFIVSLLCRMTPEQLRFVMIDPKMLELSIYNDIPHLLSPVIIDPHKAAGALKWVVCEMERRYKMMSELGVKNMQSFNAKFSEMHAKDQIPKKQVQTGFDPNTGQPTYELHPLCDTELPYIVVVIDELADLMMVAGKDVEFSIARLAQMARASGIHLLVATQRPSVDVITGLIKANIPTRISFSVTSKIDSRTVLDSMGAEQLLGKGDMLYLENGSNGLTRMHGAFIDEDECHAVVNHLKSQGPSNYVDIFKLPTANNENPASPGTNSEGDPNDPLYRQAIEVVAREQKASTSFIQRHLKIGYNRAATLIEQMEADGMISAANHVGKREVIIQQPPEEGY
ncbi:MAG: S-DNA-T family DNA segregation ATPase FtsK/SpoIIIE [Alphaproteobacteria bacterium]|jgi:S-DNA-T family DNA segregation ATPase FtsK/SpoIIIE